MSILDVVFGWCRCGADKDYFKRIRSAGNYKYHCLRCGEVCEQAFCWVCDNPTKCVNCGSVMNRFERFRGGSWCDRCHAETYTNKVL